MMLNSKSSQSKRSAWTLLRAGLAGLAVMVGGAAVTSGCLDRPVARADPKTSNVYVDEIRQTAVDKIDLLFMIDNSISMADKQAILADAVPLLVTRLITPLCVTPCSDKNCSAVEMRDGRATNPPAYAVDGKCAGGGAPEFSPIKDIHVGVITSSLGSHGAAGGKTDVCVTPEDNDHAHLLGQLRTGQMPYDANGFLKWDTTSKPAKYNPPGDSNSKAFTDKFTAMVKSSGEHGCGYEASLEAWYRFLIDPEPPANVVVPAGSSKSVVQDVDPVVLAQRAAFLRPDSLVAIVMLSDENDCSIQDTDYGWLIARGAPMYRATSQCAANPNDHCCQSCAESAPNAGCPPITGDSECTKGPTLTGMGEDDPNLRCWQQKRRFGFELLYPTTRYSDGLRSSLVPQRSTNMMVGNPLFAAAEGKTPRDKGLVFLAGIVGVPWQDIADADSLTGPGLRYLTEAELESAGKWAQILGSPNTGTNDPPILPLDPLMIETPNDRTLDAAGNPLSPVPMNPVTMKPLVGSTSMNPKANAINGHEQANNGNRDLQYACIFPLATPLLCDQKAFDDQKGCDCFTEDLPYNRPLCQPPGGGAATINQNFAKAYPGTRHLQVLKEFKDNSIVASICPKISDDKANADYGYNPAVKAIIDRLKEALKGKCLPRALVPNDKLENGLEPNQVPCKVIEAVLPQKGAACSCPEGANRAEASPVLREAVLNKLEVGQSCTKTGTMGLTPCDEFCTCELLQLKGDELKSCQNDAVAPDVAGYCYINDAPNEPHVGEPALVKDCSADAKRLLRFVGNTPAPGAIALVACLGASAASQ